MPFPSDRQALRILYSIVLVATTALTAATETAAENSPESSSGIPDLWQAASTNDVPAIRNALSRNSGVPGVDGLHESGYTALHIASSRGLER